MWQVVGQERALRVLQAAARGHRLAHAYLFVGPRSVGKATAARQFAMALNCHGEAPPCNSCRACHLIAEDKHPDVEFVGPNGVCDDPTHTDHRREWSREIRICQVRTLEHAASRAPFEGRTRVIVVDPADALNPPAANAFLKTLEEPPDHVVLVLVTDREEALLPTVRSRCRRLEFGPMSHAAIVETLQGGGWHAPEEDAERLAELAGGRFGRAIAALQDASLVEAWRQAADEAQELATAPWSQRLARAAELAGRYPREPQAVESRLEAWTEWWRRALAAAAGGHDATLDADGGRLSQYRVADAVRVLGAIERTWAALRCNANAALALEALMLDLPAPAGRN